MTRPDPAIPRITFTIPETAEALGLSTRQLEALRHRGGGPPFVRVGGPIRGRILYPVARLEAWLREQELLSTSDQPERRAAC